MPDKASSHDDETAQAGKALMVSLLVIIVGCITFFNCLQNGFVQDDVNYITSNPEMQLSSPLTYAFRKDTMFNSIGQFRPLPYLYFYYLYSAYSDNPYNYHLIQIALHCLNTYLLYLLFKHFFTKPLSVILSLLFLVHPFQVESVSYIAATDNPLFFLFGISALLLSLPEHLSWRRLTLIGSMLLIGLLIKETTVLFAVFILLYRLVFRHRQKLLTIAASSVPIALYILIRFGIVGATLDTPIRNPHYVWGQPLGIRLLNIPAILFYYLKNFIWPSHLQYDPDWIVTRIDFPHFYFPLLFDVTFLVALLAIGWITFVKRKRSWPVFVFFFVWFVVSLIFYSQIYHLDATTADRWMYLPIVGLLGTIGAGIQSFSMRSGAAKAAGVALSAVVIIMLMNRSMTINTGWQSEQTLITHRIITTDDITAQERLFDSTDNAISPTPGIWTPPIH